MGKCGDCCIVLFYWCTWILQAIWNAPNIVFRFFSHELCNLKQFLTNYFLRNCWWCRWKGNPGRCRRVEFILFSSDPHVSWGYYSIVWFSDSDLSSINISELFLFVVCFYQLSGCRKANAPPPKKKTTKQQQQRKTTIKKTKLKKDTPSITSTANRMCGGSVIFMYLKFYTSFIQPVHLIVSLCCFVRVQARVQCASSARTCENAQCLF